MVFISGFPSSLSLLFFQTLICNLILGYIRCLDPSTFCSLVANGITLKAPHYERTYRHVARRSRFLPALVRYPSFYLSRMQRYDRRTRCTCAPVQRAIPFNYGWCSFYRAARNSSRRNFVGCGTGVQPEQTNTDLSRLCLEESGFRVKRVALAATGTPRLKADTSHHVVLLPSLSSTRIFPRTMLSTLPWYYGHPHFYGYLWPSASCWAEEILIMVCLTCHSLVKALSNKEQSKSRRRQTEPCCESRFNRNEESKESMIWVSKYLMLKYVCF